jgi:hypothetical protein
VFFTLYSNREQLMKSLTMLWLTLVVAVSFSITTKAQGDSQVVELNNSDVLTMVRAKLPPQIIVAKIKSSRSHFDTFPSVLAELKYKGVSDSILLAMVEAPAGAPPKIVEEPKPEPRAEAKPANNIGGVILPDKSETPYNARFFVAPMEGGFDGLVAALMIEKKLPISVVADENLADFIVVGGTNKGPHKWYDTAFGGYERDRNQGNIRVIRVRDRIVTWAAQKGDRSLWWGPLKKGGQRKVAERLVNKMKDDLFKSEF